VLVRDAYPSGAPSPITLFQKTLLLKCALSNAKFVVNLKSFNSELKKYDH
jgi:hypothetical protein